ncbi:hypothetical protein EniyanLRS_159 [Mycobacterium phage EniyanLRS]|uniref:Uncharacterized protein n=1 Tax=Mycobacterium phage EniyanLRS TaxID=1933770 RepID=A0A2I2MPM7_9CAUD|nr:hypothetical protein EniyanLRS_159 [Mycobacterium phage EniyanLRS]
MNFGNHYVDVRVYKTIQTKYTRTTSKVLETPTFMLGGIGGQMMSPTQVVSTVVEMFGLKNATLYVNGQPTQEGLTIGQETAHAYITIHFAGEDY